MKYDLTTLFDDDARGRFESTVVSLSILKEKPRLYWVGGCDRTCFIFYDENAEKTIFGKGAIVAEQVILETILPTSRWYQVGKHAYFVLRQPARQWRRSMCQNTHAIFTAFPDQNIRKELGFAHTFLRNWEIALASKPLELAEASRAFDKKKLHSAVIGDSFAVNGMGELFNHSEKIGKLDFKEKTFNIVPSFRDEVFPLLGDSYREKSC